MPAPQKEPQPKPPVVRSPDAIVWDFEAGDITWQPRAKTVTLCRAEGVGATEGSNASLRVQGRMDTGWNYAASDHRPMTPGRLYRLSAYLRVDKLGAATPMPTLKCEFVPADGKKDLGRVFTEAYDQAKMGTWQRQETEFRAPDGVAGCWVAMEKGTQSPTEIDACLDDVVVEPIERLAVFDRYRLDPLPAPLAKVRGVHPRIYLTAGRIAELRKAIETTHKGIWTEVRAQADSAVKRGAPKYILRDEHSGDEQLWQREVGNTMPTLAIAYVLTGERKYLDAAREWALASCGYETWGLGTTDGMDLVAGHQLSGLGIVYDWCYDGLGDAARKTIRETLVKRTSALFEAAATGKVWWHRCYLQNHLWVNICGMSVAGLALFDEVDGADKWIGLPLDKFRRTMAALGDDGASHEGVGYWGYGVEYMLKFMELARHLLGVDMYDNDWWRNTAAYRIYMSLPRNSWTKQNSIVDIADCPRVNWYGPDYLLRRLAQEYRDKYAQWLAQQVDDANTDSAEARWLNLIWFDPAVAPSAPGDLPTMRHFKDMDIVSARSNWSGDESLVVFKCGPFIGHKAAQQLAYDPGGGHVHPDANHFLVFGCGEWLIRDDGYRAKWTGQHNTLLVNGEGQIGEGRMWFDGSVALKAEASPRIVCAKSAPDLDIVTGDASHAYPKDLGLRRYVRHLLFIKPDMIVVCDDIVLDEARPLELRFHPEQKAAQREDDAFMVQGKAAFLRLELLTQDGVTITAEEVPAAGRGEGQGKDTMFTIRLCKDAQHWRNAVAVSWSKTEGKPPVMTLRADGDRWTFSGGGREVTLDWAKGAAELRAARVRP